MYPEVISVASMHPDDSVWDYCTTAKVDVIAPSGRSTDHPIWTLDQMDTLGRNNNYIERDCGDPNDMDYNCDFGGTSAAQPVAAGVGALVSSRRPDLTREELYEVIKYSADPNLYTTITNPPDQKYGYGMVHPYRALLSVIRGDVNNDGTLNLLDITDLIAALYNTGDPPAPDWRVGDANCNGAVNILDVTFLTAYLYKGGSEPQNCFIYDYVQFPDL